VCMGRGASSATPLFETATTYADDTLENIDMAGFIFEPYNDGQFIVKTTWFKAFNLPGMDMATDIDGMPVVRDDFGNGDIVDLGSDPEARFTYESTEFNQYGDIQGAAVSVLVDGLADDGFLADTKLFGSFAWSKTEPEAGSMMLGSADDETGTSYWVGAQVPVTEKGNFGVEFNHGSQYWRPFTYAEDTMIGSKLAARGDAWEAYFNYQITDALSAQVRYTDISYDYTGSNGFFGNYSGGANSIDDMKAGAAGWDQMGGGNPANPTDIYNVAETMAVMNGTHADPTDPNDPFMAQAGQMAGAKAMLPNIVEAAQDFRFYLRYRF